MPDGFAVFIFPLFETWLPLLLLFYLAAAIIIGTLIGIALYLKRCSKNTHREKPTEIQEKMLKKNEKQ